MLDPGMPLVGRRAEIRWLRRRLEIAIDGAPQCVLVVGEPGIGKSRLALETRDTAKASGFVALAGRSYEESDLPFLTLRDEVLPFLVRHCEETGHPIPPALAVAGGGEGSEPGYDPDDGASSRLLLELSGLLLDAAARRPLFILLDDLHWADDSSMALLRHVVYRLAGRLPPTRLLIVATAHAGPEIEPLRREHHCSVIEIVGLDALESAELAKTFGASRLLPSSLLTQSGGNPMAIEAMARNGYGPARTRLVPDAVDAMLGSLSGPCRAMLARAALLVPDASIDALLRVGSSTEHELEVLVDEAARAGVVNAERGGIAFTSATVHGCCLHQLGPAAQRRAHAEIAAALGPPEGSSLLAVARHLVLSGALADPDELSEVTDRAARRAMQLCAWGEAAQMFEATLAAQHQRREPMSPIERAERHFRAGKCRRYSLELVGAVEHFDAAAELSRSAGDKPGELRGLIHRLLCLIAEGRVAPHEVEPLEKLAAEVVDSVPDLAAEALVDVSQAQWAWGSFDEARSSVDRALALTEPRDLHVPAERAFVSRSVTDWITVDLEAALDALTRADAHAALADDPTCRIGPAYRVPLTLLWLGRLRAAASTAEAATDLADELRSLYEFGLVLAAKVGLAVLRGDIAAAEDHADRALRLQRLSGYQWAAGLFLPVLAMAYANRGDYAAADGALDDWDETADGLAGLTLGLLRDLVAVRDGRAGAEVLERIPSLPAMPLLGGQDWAVIVVELATRFEAPALAAPAVDLITATMARGMRVSSSLGTFLDRAAGDGHALLGNDRRAREHYEAAIALADETGAATEGALARVGLARLCAPTDRAGAAVALRLALPVLEQLGLSLLEADELAAAVGAGSASPRRVEGEPVARARDVLFFDVVDSTQLTEELGDVVYWRRARALESRLRTLVAEHGGATMPGVTVGDGVVALFDDPSAAVRAALAAIEAAHPTGLRLHAGVHHGPVLHRGETVYGAAVNLAARVCAESGPDEMLVSAEVHRLLSGAGGTEVAFVDRGAHALKGFAAPQQLFAVVASG